MYGEPQAPPRFSTNAVAQASFFQFYCHFNLLVREVEMHPPKFYPTQCSYTVLKVAQHGGMVPATGM